MARAPAQHYISLDKKEAVLVWNYPTLFSKKPLLFTLLLALIFGLLVLFEKGSIAQAGMVSLSSIVGMLIIGALVQKAFNSNAYRMGLAISHAEIGTDGFFWKFSIPWNTINKIESTRAVHINLPVAQSQLWIYPQNRVPRFVSVPKLTPQEYKDFMQILSWHTQANNIELIAE